MLNIEWMIKLKLLKQFLIKLRKGYDLIVWNAFCSTFMFHKYLIETHHKMEIVLQGRRHPAQLMHH